jgi:hypothetical protein
MVKPRTVPRLVFDGDPTLVLQSEDAANSSAVVQHVISSCRTQELPRSVSGTGSAVSPTDASHSLSPSAGSAVAAVQENPSTRNSTLYTPNEIRRFRQDFRNSRDQYGQIGRQGFSGSPALGSNSDVKIEEKCSGSSALSSTTANGAFHSADSSTDVLSVAAESSNIRSATRLKGVSGNAFAESAAKSRSLPHSIRERIGRFDSIRDVGRELADDGVECAQFQPEGSVSAADARRTTSRLQQMRHRRFRSKQHILGQPSIPEIQVDPETMEGVTLQLENEIEYMEMKFKGIIDEMTNQNERLFQEMHAELSQCTLVGELQSKLSSQEVENAELRSLLEQVFDCSERLLREKELEKNEFFREVKV